MPASKLSWMSGVCALADQADSLMEQHARTAQVVIVVLTIDYVRKKVANGRAWMGHRDWQEDHAALLRRQGR